jgi:hypothetical protein
MQGATNEEAIHQVWADYGGFLDPEDLALLTDDLDSYRGDTPLGMELVASEQDLRVPLFLHEEDHEARQIYFRFTLDALYRRIGDATAFYHRDYKSSKWRRTQAEVDKDLQMWSYNFGIFEMFPECSSLIQSYEQLRFGNLTTGKNAEQRQQMRAWLIQTIKAILADEKLEPKQNQWCPYCPLVVTCDQTIRASRYWRARLGVLAPKTKEGRKVRINFSKEAGELERLISEVLPIIIESRKHMELAEKELKTIIEQMPSEQRDALGWRTSDRRTKILSPEGLRELHAVMGDNFYEVVSLVRANLEKVAEDGQALQVARDYELERVSTTTVTQR